MQIKENLVVTCSGGETSMTVTLYCLKYLQDRYNILVVFANTGVESNKTLDFLKRCQDEFQVPIRWIEAKVYHGKRKSCGYYEVDYETATRNTDWKYRDNTPFEEVIKKYKLPNHSRLHCTRELKMNPIKAFAKDYFDRLDFEGWLREKALICYKNLLYCIIFLNKISISIRIQKFIKSLKNNINKNTL